MKYCVANSPFSVLLFQKKIRLKGTENCFGLGGRGGGYRHIYALLATKKSMYYVPLNFEVASIK
jgi:hypothetical protein